MDLVLVTASLIIARIRSGRQKSDSGGLAKLAVKCKANNHFLVRVMDLEQIMVFVVIANALRAGPKSIPQNIRGLTNLEGK
jgi:hypothetical protein